MRRKRLFRVHLCLLLRDSLDDAFRGEVRPDADWLSDWGQVTAALVHRRYPDRPEARTAVWHTMRTVLWDLAGSHSCEELSHHILQHPETFLTTILMMGVPDGPELPAGDQATRTLH